ncbi:MAG: sulfite exporter TauE/SafE family protein [Gemmatimonadetes bacterium]|nr:sulfite exporter TauE/SafE family protein [Gemmatimonadota bacterium]
MSFDAKQLLLGALALVTLYHIASLVVGLRGRKPLTPTPTLLVISFVANFFDTLGIGSFATTTAAFRATKTVRDDVIPGTLNAGYTMATLLQAVIYTQAVDVDPTTLIGMIAAAVVGAWLGAGVVAKWPINRIRLGMGLCLAAAAALFIAQALNILPGGGTATGVTGVKLGIALAGNLVLGALMTIGIGLYGPCMLLVSMLGMSPVTAFPVMMGSCAFLMPTAATQFLRAGRVNYQAVTSMIIGGIPAVLIAAFLVKSMPLNVLRWLVAAVVAYTSFTLLQSARQANTQTEPAAV